MAPSLLGLWSGRWDSMESQGWAWGGPPQLGARPPDPCFGPDLDLCSGSCPETAVPPLEVLGRVGAWHGGH